MKLILILFLFFNLYLTKVQLLVNEIDICSSSQKIPFTEINSDLHLLMEWCMNDPNCALIFHQQYQFKNFTIFKLLTKSIYYKSSDFLDPIKSLICESESQLEIVSNIWPLILMSKQDLNLPICEGVNRILSINPQTLAFECVCIPNSNCTEPSINYTYLWIFLSIIAAGIVFICLCVICSSNRYFKTLDIILSTAKNK